MNEVRILWVDDEVDLLKSHVLFLRGKGYDVDTCNNGADAIEMVRTTPYDLIILDEMMPGMTGLETLPLIKEQRPTTPVIMVTKSEEESIMDKAIGSKIADYHQARQSQPGTPLDKEKRTFPTARHRAEHRRLPCRIRAHLLLAGRRPRLRRMVCHLQKTGKLGD